MRSSKLKCELIFFLTFLTLFYSLGDPQLVHSEKGFTKSPLLISDKLNLTPINSAGIPTNSGMLDDGIFYHYYWQNSSWEPTQYSDNFTYTEIFLLNNGTDDIWVEIETDSNYFYSYRGKTNYFTFEIFEDGDQSVLDSWNDNLSTFSEVNWQNYQNYYWNNYEEGWSDYSDPEFSPPEYDDSADNGSFSGFELGDMYDSLEPTNWNLNDYNEQDISAYQQMHSSLTGDEKWWFFNVYWEDWTDEYFESYSYVWRNLDTGEVINPNDFSWQPVSGYESDWETAQWMLTNETFNQSLQWSWFSYDLSQWVSWYDVVSDSLDFIISTTSYDGMSIYNDSNQNGVADAFYEYGGDGIFYDQEDSEYLGYFTVNKLEDIRFNLSTANDSGEIDFSLDLFGVQLTATPYDANYEDFLYYSENYLDNSTWDIGSNSSVVPWNQSTNYYLNSMKLLCNFRTQETNNTASTFSLKQQIGDIYFAENLTSAADEFSGLGLTLDYSVSSNFFSDFVSMDVPGTSYDYNSETIEGNVGIQVNQSRLMEMDLIHPYIWGFDHKEYQNTVVLNPSYGYLMHFGSLNLGMGAETSEQLAPYSYSLCFENWGGFSLTLDPTFTSFLSASPSDTELFPPSNNGILTRILIFSFLGFAIVFGLLMSKQEYRAFLLNRILPIETGAHRLTMEDILDNENRSKVIDLIIEEPGIHFSEILRRTELAPGNLNWHLEILERYKIIKSEIIGKYVMYFPYYQKNPLSTIDLKLQKSKTTMEIIGNNSNHTRFDSKRNRQKD